MFIHALEQVVFMHFRISLHNLFSQSKLDLKPVPYLEHYALSNGAQGVYPYAFANGSSEFNALSRLSTYRTSIFAVISLA